LVDVVVVVIVEIDADDGVYLGGTR